MKNSLYKPTTSVLILALCLLFSLPVQAFFSNTELLGDNQMSAHSLYITLGVQDEDADSRTVLVSNDSTLPFDYTIRVEEITNPEDSFCDEITLSINGGESTDLLSFSSATTRLDVDDSENLLFEFSVDTDAGVSGRSCAVEFVYEASQENFSYGEAFYDREVDVVTLYGNDFVSDPAPDDDNACCACADVIIENENDATIINIVNSSSNTGGNSAGSGGTVTTGNATTTTTIVNNVNRNNTTVVCGEDVQQAGDGDSIDEEIAVEEPEEEPLVSEEEEEL